MKKIIISPIYILLLLSFCQAQYLGKGRVVSTETHKPIGNASIALRNSGTSALTNADGEFSVTIKSLPDTLVVTIVGFKSRMIRLADGISTQQIMVELTPDVIELEEVMVNTGYYSVPRERATGSFTAIDNQLLNRSVSTDIISRLEGVTNGLQFERIGNVLENGEPANLRIRGISSINSDTSPLIVVDNFPYEGQINDINPNDVENITILKDASAASIWGARAGNGVIVITTKSGRYNQPVSISLNSNINIQQRPDLFGNPAFIPSEDWMPVEEFLFGRNFYGEEDDFAPLPPYVELLIQQRDGLITDSDFQAQKRHLQQNDVRNDAFHHLYRNAVNQQYALNLTGGTAAHKFYLSGGYDRNLDNIIGNEYRRTSLSFTNSMKLHRNLEANLGLYYTGSRNQNNGVSLQGIRPLSFNTPPYTELIDDSGNHLPVVDRLRIPYYEAETSLGLLDWAYRPLDERSLSDNRNTDNRLRFDGSLKYTITPSFTAEARYQFQHNNGERKVLNGKESYYARNLINRFTQPDGTQVIPYGGILEGSNSGQTAHYGRIQLNYRGMFADKHLLSALAGAEVRNDQSRSDRGYLVYGYNDDVLSYTDPLDFNGVYPTNPNGAYARIPANAANFTDILERNVSYFGNASYTYADRYVLSVSSRWDASNLFGVKTNQKGVPLWSTGLSWDVSKEPFWQTEFVPYLRMRATYGVNGNINRRVSALPTILIFSDYVSPNNVAKITAPGNPNLRWEKVKSFNAGVDFGLTNNRITGRVEYFVKNAADLIGERYMDPTTGIGGLGLRNMINYANMRTQGWDVEVSSRNITGAFEWNTVVLFNYSRNEITNYELEDRFSLSRYVGTTPPPTVGKSKDILYSLPWAGLDAETGMPLVKLNGLDKADYSGYMDQLTYEDLVVSGVRVPPYYGALRNTLTWKNLSLSVNLTWKAGYVFRRRSVNYSQMFNVGEMHMDFLERWRHQGDENRTGIPAMPTDIDANRDYVFLNSEYLVESGNHIRWQDAQLSYLLDTHSLLHGKGSIESVRLSLYANNILMLWQQSKSGLDPDFPNASYPNPRTLAIGLQVKF